LLEDFPIFSGDPMSLNCFTPDEKLTLFKALANDPDIKQDVRAWFDEMLITSELRPIQRTAKIEEITGLEDSELDNPSIPQQISILNERVDFIEENGVASCPTEPQIIPSEGVADNRAVTLYQEALKAKEEGVTFFGSGKINAILRSVVPEQYRVKEGQNIGQAKKETFAKLTMMFPGMFKLNKKEHGRHEYRLVF
jgi:hypothetical protein